MDKERDMLHVYYAGQVKGKILNNLNKECEDKKRLYNEYLKNASRHNQELEEKNRTINRNYTSERERIDRWNQILREQEHYNHEEKKRQGELKSTLTNRKKERERLEKDVYRFKNDLVKYQGTRKHLEERQRKLTLKEEEVNQEINVLEKEVENRKKLIEKFEQQKKELESKINELAPQ